MPDEILSNTPGSFPWSVLHNRHPALLKQVRDGLPYPPDVRRALDAFAGEITGVIKPLRPTAHDYETWQEWGQDYLGERWDDVPFLWAESFFYRKLLEAVGYFEPGPWSGVDPFEPFKSAELQSLDDLPETAPAPKLLTASLWGNQADLGFRIDTPAAQSEDLSVIDDQSARLWSLLEKAGTVHIVADNAGRELLPDLLLADHFLETRHVVLHVKPYPYYVSDATTADVIACLRRLSNETGQRLTDALTDGRLRLDTHDFYCAPWSFHHMPAELAQEFATAALTVFKGDLNYRRLVGDRAWPPTTTFESATAYFPGPVAALRTLKSDVVVGLPAEVVAKLDATGENWRTSGTHALVQVRA